MSGGGKGDNRGNRRRPFFRRREQSGHSRVAGQDSPNDTREKKTDYRRNPENIIEKNKEGRERPVWTPPKLRTEPMPVPECPYCGKPIRELSMAISDKNSGKPIHFDCIISRISENEVLEKGDSVSYIGGGRFGIIHYNNPSNPQSFVIKKIFEWEIKENRAEWRQTVSDHFSVT